MTLATTPVKRETASEYRTRPLIVTMHARHLEIREKGRRDTFTVDYLAIYELAMKLRFRLEQTDKKGKIK